MSECSNSFCLRLARRCCGVRPGWLMTECISRTSATLMMQLSGVITSWQRLPINLREKLLLSYIF